MSRLNVMARQKRDAQAAATQALAALDGAHEVVQAVADQILPADAATKILRAFQASVNPPADDDQPTDTNE